MVEEALPVFEAAGDEVGLACALGSLADVLSLTGRSARCSRRWSARSPTRPAAARSRRARESWPAWPAPTMPDPRRPTRASARMRQLLAEAEVGPTTRAAVEVSAIAGLEAMRGNAEEARTICMRSRAIFEEFGQVNRLVDHGLHAARVEMLADSAGDRGGLSARELRRARARWERRWCSRRSPSSSPRASTCRAGSTRRTRWPRRARQLAEDDDAEVQVLSRAIRAKLLARTGDPATGEQLAREADERAQATDQLNLQGAALLAIAEVLSRSGRAGEAAAAAGEASSVFSAKGNLVCARRADALVGSASREMPA